MDIFIKQGVDVITSCTRAMPLQTDNLLRALVNLLDTIGHWVEKAPVGFTRMDAKTQEAHAQELRTVKTSVDADTLAAQNLSSDVMGRAGSAKRSMGPHAYTIFKLRKVSAVQDGLNESWDGLFKARQILDQIDGLCKKATEVSESAWRLANARTYVSEAMSDIREVVDYLQGRFPNTGLELVG